MKRGMEMMRKTFGDKEVEQQMSKSYKSEEGVAIKRSYADKEGRR